MRLEINAEIVMDAFERILNFTIIPKENMHLVNVTCRGYDDLLKTVLTETITLNITYPPRVKLKAVPSAVISEGSLVVLKCNHDSNPESKIFNWTKNKMSLQQTDPSSNIVFKHIHREDAGSYRCTVCNELGRSSASLQLIVLYAPIVSVVTLTNGSILCNATGVPSVYRFSRWEHLSEFGEHIRYLVGSEDGVLNVLPEAGSLAYINSGKYACTVENGIRGHLQKVKQTGFIFLQFQGEPLCINGTDRILESVDNKQRRFVKLSVTVTSFPAYDSIKWLHRDKIITTNLARYSFDSMDTIVQTKIHGRLVHINGYRFSVAFTAFTQEDYRNFSLVISNNNGTAICSVTEQWKESGDGLSNMCKESLFYVILPLCLLALSGWIAFFIYYKKRHRMPVGIVDDLVRQQNQELQVVTNYYDEVNDGEISNQSLAQYASAESSFSLSDRSENTITSTNNGRVELTDLTYINPYQQLIANAPNNSHKYASLTRSHHYFVVIDSHISHLSNLKRHTY
ncbi:synaptogenesis protein syg-2-like isoform X2 [Mytilus californianus]|nr:synaptogenesis protein syg-2-like isoform X2 [Mytilus californianus]